MAKVRIYSDNSTTFSALFLDKQGGEGKTDTLHETKTHLERTKTELVWTNSVFVTPFGAFTAPETTRCHRNEASPTGTPYFNDDARREPFFGGITERQRGVVAGCTRHTLPGKISTVHCFAKNSG